MRLHFRFSIFCWASLLPSPLLLTIILTFAYCLSKLRMLFSYLSPYLPLLSLELCRLSHFFVFLPFRPAPLYLRSLRSLLFLARFEPEPPSPCISTLLHVGSLRGLFPIHHKVFKYLRPLSCQTGTGQVSARSQRAFLRANQNIIYAQFERTHSDRTSASSCSPITCSGQVDLHHGYHYHRPVPEFRFFPKCSTAYRLGSP